MKTTILIIALSLISGTACARTGWYMKNWSILYGAQLSSVETSHEFSLLYDNYQKNCVRTLFTNYGYGASFANKANTQDLSLVLTSYPLRKMWGRTRHSRIIPFVSLTGVSSKSKLDEQSNKYLRPSIGFTAIGMNDSKFTFRIRTSIGYDINNSFVQKGKGTVVSIGLGIGINTRKKGVTTTDLP